MGLDWILEKHKPKAGCEERYHQLSEELDYVKENDRDSDRIPQLKNDFAQVSVSCFEVLKCPRVGIDDAATVWFKKEVYEPKQERVAQLCSSSVLAEMDQKYIQYWNRPFEEILRDVYGNWVPDLALEEGGFAKVRGMVTTPVDFRGKLIGYNDVLTDDLKEEAYKKHTAEESLDYADRLEKCVEEFKENNKAWSSHEEDIEVVRNAIEWLRFWGFHLFGWHPWW